MSSQRVIGVAHTIRLRAFLFSHVCAPLDSHAILPLATPADESSEKIMGTSSTWMESLKSWTSLMLGSFLGFTACLFRVRRFLVLVGERRGKAQ